MVYFFHFNLNFKLAVVTLLWSISVFTRFCCRRTLHLSVYLLIRLCTYQTSYLSESALITLCIYQSPHLSAITFISRKNICSIATLLHFPIRVFFNRVFLEYLILLLASSVLFFRFAKKNNQSVKLSPRFRNLFF